MGAALKHSRQDEIQQAGSVMLEGNTVVRSVNSSANDVALCLSYDVLSSWSWWSREELRQPCFSVLPQSSGGYWHWLIIVSTIYFCLQRSSSPELLRSQIRWWLFFCNAGRLDVRGYFWACKWGRKHKPSCFFYLCLLAFLSLSWSRGWPVMQTAVFTPSSFSSSKRGLLVWAPLTLLLPDNLCTSAGYKSGLNPWAIFRWGWDLGEHDGRGNKWDVSTWVQHSEDKWSDPGKNSK